MEEAFKMTPNVLMSSGLHMHTQKHTFSAVMKYVNCSVVTVTYEVSNGLPHSSTLKTFHRKQTWNFTLV